MQRSGLGRAGARSPEARSAHTSFITNGKKAGSYPRVAPQLVPAPAGSSLSNITYTYIHTYIQTYIHIYIHTYIHIYAGSSVYLCDRAHRRHTEPPSGRLLHFASPPPRARAHTHTHTPSLPLAVSFMWRVLLLLRGDACLSGPWTGEMRGHSPLVLLPSFCILLPSFCRCVCPGPGPSFRCPHFAALISLPSFRCPHFAASPGPWTAQGPDTRIGSLAAATASSAHTHARTHARTHGGGGG